MAAPSAGRCLGNMRLWTRPRFLTIVFSGVRARCHHAVPLPDNQLSSSSPAVLSQLSPGLTVQPDFITAEEEAALCRELEPVLKKKRYESGHWDDAIHGFREVERLHWSADSSAIIQKVREKAFPSGENQLSLVHVLDLQKDGYIKPHVDSVKFCGNTIAGICLLSSSVMRLVSVNNPEERADLLLSRRCLYIMSGVARYKFTHEILRSEESFFNGVPVPRERRISVICRCLPLS